MIYKFVENFKDSLEGKMYNIATGKAVFIKDINLKELDIDFDYKVGIMCQKVSEGDSLTRICKLSWAIGFVEFMNLIQNKSPEYAQYAEWYSKAFIYRNRGLIENLYLKIKNFNPNDNNRLTLQSLNQNLLKLSTLLGKKDEEISRAKSPVSINIYDLPTIKTRWKKDE